MNHQYEDMILNTTDENKDELLQWISNPKSEIDQDYLINRLFERKHLTDPLNQIKEFIPRELLEKIDTNSAKFLILIRILTSHRYKDAIIYKEQYKHVVKNKELLMFLNNDNNCGLEIQELFTSSLNLMEQTGFYNPTTKDITNMTCFTFAVVKMQLDKLKEENNQIKEENKELKKKLDELYEMVMWHPDGPGAEVAKEHARKLAYSQKNQNNTIQKN